MSNVVFSIAKDFSPNPGPRYKRQGANSGEALRRRLLEVLEKTDGEVIIDLDGTKGIGSSFLDEAFGGLVRWNRKAKDDLLRRFKFQSRVDPSYIDEIVDSISHAEPQPESVH